MPNSIQNRLLAADVVDPWFLHCANHRDSLIPILFDENTDMGILEIFFSQKIPDLPLQLIGCEALHPQYPDQRKADIPLGANPNSLIQLLFLKDRDFDQVLRSDFIIAIIDPFPKRGFSSESSRS